MSERQPRSLKDLTVKTAAVAGVAFVTEGVRRLHKGKEAKKQELAESSKETATPVESEQEKAHKYNESVKGRAYHEWYRKTGTYSMEAGTLGNMMDRIKRVDEFRAKEEKRRR